MKQSYVIGVDISKSKIDCALMSVDLTLLKEKEIVNTDLKVKTFLIKLLKELSVDASKVLICCENTGIYNRPLERVCEELGVDLWVEHPLKIKRASTDMRGKNDRKDAIRIAEYAIRYQDKQVLYKEPSGVLKKLDNQIKIRETLLNDKVRYENQLREAKSHDPEEYKELYKAYKPILKGVEKSILIAEKKSRSW
jgi:transposase